MRSLRPTESSKRTGAEEAIAIGVQFVGQKHVFESRKRGDELIRLKNKADLLTAHLCEFIFAELADFGAVQKHLSLCRRVQTGEQAEQRALPAAGGAHDGDEFPGGTSRSIPLRISTVLVPLRMDFFSPRTSIMP